MSESGIVNVLKLFEGLLRLRIILILDLLNAGRSIYAAIRTHILRIIVHRIEGTDKLLT